MPRKRQGTQESAESVDTNAKAEAPASTGASSGVENELKRRRSLRSFPAASFEEALDFAKSIFRIGAGQPVKRLTLFDQLGVSPESGPSRQLIINAGRYGLTKGGVQAESIELTPEGLKAVDDEASPRETARARISLAIEKVEPFSALYQRFVGNKLPAKAALVDAVIDAGVEQAHASEAVDTFIVNLRFVGLLKILSGADRIVSVDLCLDSLPATNRTPQPRTGSTSQTSLVTAEHAQYESTCFFIAPIGEEGSEARKHSDLFLGSFIEPALEEFDLRVVRADAIDKPGIITRQIIEHIVRCRLVIADLSFHNPNVFYELALRHAVKLPIVQIIRHGEKIPFDVLQMRTIAIDTTDIYTLLPKVDSYRAEIANQVRRALDPTHVVDTPISNYFPNMEVKF